ncbi:hypothetical protein CYMTET_23735 [Cymbomonas tetramitiformis]|uniref:Uncharacterized protein n=1 Tax=Cymbomonas tetramitiformis TaxID=36881 RepID=A0AAE0FXB5_9CHLO|nr:hypothetical protein CYMTET_23735 [Cymbomonas tetramitiformis]
MQSLFRLCTVCALSFWVCAPRSGGEEISSAVHSARASFIWGIGETPQVVEPGREPSPIIATDLRQIGQKGKGKTGSDTKETQRTPRQSSSREGTFSRAERNSRAGLDYTGTSDTREKPPQEASEKRFTILTAYTDEISAYAERSTLNKQLYGLRHRYDVIVERRPFTSGRHPSWEKISLILKHLRSTEYLLWMDADTLIMNAETNLESIVSSIDSRVECEMWACQDQALLNAEDWKASNYNGIPSGYLLNAGVMLFRNTSYVNNFLQDLWALGDDPRYLSQRYDMYLDRKPASDPTRGWPWEQGAFWEILTNSSKARQRMCMSYQRFNVLTNPSESWEDNFVFHMTDWDAKSREGYSYAVLLNMLNPSVKVPSVIRE